MDKSQKTKIKQLMNMSKYSAALSNQMQIETKRCNFFHLLDELIYLMDIFSASEAYCYWQYKIVRHFWKALWQH